MKSHNQNDNGSQPPTTHNHNDHNHRNHNQHKHDLRHHKPHKNRHTHNHHNGDLSPQPLQQLQPTVNTHTVARQAIRWAQRDALAHTDKHYQQKQGHGVSDVKMWRPQYGTVEILPQGQTVYLSKRGGHWDHLAFPFCWM